MRQQSLSRSRRTVKHNITWIAARRDDSFKQCFRLLSRIVEAPVGSPDANGNLIGGPVHGVIDPLLGPLADNGGFELPDGSHILTHALLPGSPAINAGDLSAVAGMNGVSEFDQRGEPFGRIVGGRIDIGAFEYQTPTDLNLWSTRSLTNRTATTPAATSACGKPSSWRTRTTTKASSIPSASTPRSRPPARRRSSSPKAN